MNQVGIACLGPLHLSHFYLSTDPPHSRDPQDGKLSEGQREVCQ